MPVNYSTHRARQSTDQLLQAEVKLSAAISSQQTLPDTHSWPADTLAEAIIVRDSLRRLCARIADAERYAAEVERRTRLGIPLSDDMAPARSPP